MIVAKDRQQKWWIMKKSEDNEICAICKEKKQTFFNNESLMPGKVCFECRKNTKNKGGINSIDILEIPDKEWEVLQLVANL